LNHLKATLRFFGRLGIAAAVVFVLVLARLSYSPAPVAFLANTIAEPFRTAFPGQDLTYDGATLAWKWRNLAFEFSLENIAIVRADGEALAQFPKLAVAFDPGNLLLGRFIPARVDLYGADLVIPWSSQALARKVQQAMEEEKEDETKQPGVFRFLEQLLEGESESSPLRLLRRVDIKDATVRLADRDSGVVWGLPDSQLSLQRAGSGITVDGEFHLIAGADTVTVTLRSGRTRAGGLRADLDVAGLNPAALAREVGLAGIFQVADMPLFGTFTVLQNAQGGINTIAMDLGGGPGAIFYAPLQPAPMRFEVFSIKAEADLPASRLRIENVYASIDGASVQGDGVATFTPASDLPALNMVLAGDNMRLSTLLKFWPGGEDASGGRLWLEENIPSGVLKNLNAEINFQPETWKMRPFPDDAFRISLQFERGTVHYLRPMPPLEDAAGTMVVTGNSLAADIMAGSVDGIDASGLTFRISDLTRPKAEQGEARFHAAGPLPQLLALLDHEPLRVLAKHGLNPADYFGEAEADAVVRMPLTRGTGEDVTYQAKAKVRQAAVPSIISGGGLTNGELEAVITEKGLVANGTADLREAPFDFYWTQDFLPAREGEFTTRIELSGNLTDANLRRFGAPNDLTMESTARVYMSLRGIDGQLKEGQATVDFFNTAVEARKMDWHKPANTRADASFALAWTEDELQVRNAKVRSREFTLDGAFAFDSLTGLLKRADIPVYAAGQNDLTVTAKQRTDGILDVVVQAKTLNAAPYISTMFDPAGGPSFAPDMKMTLMAREAHALNGVVFKNLSVEAEQRQDAWVRANVLGALDTVGAFQLTLDYAKGVRHLEAKSDNAGRTALGLNVFRNAQGGSLTLTADLNVFEPKLTAKGTLEASNVHMVKSTALIEALAKEEQSGLDPMIKEEGVNFHTLVFPFTLANGVFDLSRARASGPSFGFTMEGEIDQKFERMNLNGVVVPAYTLNALLGKIPVIGAIITGGPGKGVISLNYRISGTRDNPKVDFNPMSAITPGILRLFVGNKKGAIPPDEDKPAPPEGEPQPDSSPGAEEPAAAPEGSEDGGGAIQP
jgi:AsmA-like C-terminal region/Protein of unknown function